MNPHAIISSRCRRRTVGLKHRAASAPTEFRQWCQRRLGRAVACATYVEHNGRVDDLAYGERALCGLGQALKGIGWSHAANVVALSYYLRAAEDECESGEE
jgi:hypothetical protein